MGRRRKQRAPDVVGGGLRIRALGEGPRVVMLHGGPGLDHHVLLPFAEQLAPDFEVWLPDLPGHGAHARGRPRLSDLVARVERWLADADCDALVGHSLGALVARRVLGRGHVHPRAAVLLAPPAGERARDARRPHERSRDVDHHRRALLDEVRSQLGRAPDPAFMEAVERAHLTGIAEHEALTRGIAHALSQPTPKCRPGCPTLVVAGDADPVVTPHQASCVAQATAGARLVVVEGLGHFPAAGGDDGVAEAVRAFLADALGDQARR